jgi:hypothetical protein
MSLAMAGGAAAAWAIRASADHKSPITKFNTFTKQALQLAWRRLIASPGIVAYVMLHA